LFPKVYKQRFTKIETSLESMLPSLAQHITVKVFLNFLKLLLVPL